MNQSFASRPHKLYISISWIWIANRHNLMHSRSQYIYGRWLKIGRSEPFDLD